MRFITLLLRGFLFFVLFAFAMNNQHEVRLKWFFGYEWRTSMVYVVLAAFIAGAALGLLGHLPGWWRRWRDARAASALTSKSAIRAQASTDTALADLSARQSGPDTLIEPPRDGL